MTQPVTHRSARSQAASPPAPAPIRPPGRSRNRPGWDDLGLPGPPNPRAASRRVHIREPMLVAGLLAVAGLALGLNLLGFPYVENDEGVYAGQAWAVLHLGQLAPYAYIYDHPPLGWLLLAAWTGLTGSLHAFGSALAAGRALMLVLHLLSTLLVYLIGRRVSGRPLAGAVAALLFALSAVGLYYHRRILLDNIATFWLLVSLFVLVGPSVRTHLSPGRLVLSALAIGLAILSKEVVAVFALPLALLAGWRLDGWRWRPTLGWLAVVGTIAALYPLLALGRGELAPEGVPLVGTSSGISLIGTLSEQAGRDRDGGLLQPGGHFWEMAARWTREEPLLVVGGTAASILLALSIRRRPVAGTLGLAALAFWAFLGRGGQTLPFYLVPLLPLLALVVALAATDMVERLAPHTGSEGTGRWRPWQTAFAAGLPLLLLLPGYTAPTLGLDDDPGAFWSNRQVEAQRQAIGWLREHADPSSRIVVDDALWVDLRDGPPGAPNFPNAHPYWKAERDPSIHDDVLAGDWRRMDYLVVSPQLRSDAEDADLPMVRAALENGQVVASFDSGGWPLEVRRLPGRR